MKKLTILFAVWAVVAGATWFFLFRGASVEVQWGGREWPSKIRGVGEAVERVVHAGHGKPTAADRARAKERARWKAYYYAQLRLAEQLGGLAIDAHTTVHDAVLADREVRAAYSGTIHAAAEVASGATVEDLPDAVRVTVTVEAPAPGVAGLRETIARALAGGKLSVKLAGRTKTPEADDGPASGTQPAPKTAPASPTEASTRSAEPQGRAHQTPKDHPSRRGHARRASRKPSKPRYTGCVLHLPENPNTLVAAPDFYDAAGVYLASALDLPASARAEGIPVAVSSDTATIEKVAGRHPVELEATITAGNIMLQRTLDPREADLFAMAVRHNRVILVLGEERG